MMVVVEGRGEINRDTKRDRRDRQKHTDRRLRRQKRKETDTKIFPVEFTAKEKGNSRL